MDEQKDKRAEDLAKEMDSLQVTELDDKDLEGAVGGMRGETEIALSGNTNCGCGGNEFTGGSNNENCGCP